LDKEQGAARLKGIPAKKVIIAIHEGREGILIGLSIDLRMIVKVDSQMVKLAWGVSRSTIVAHGG